MDADHELKMDLSRREIRVLLLHEFRLGHKATEAANNICSTMGEDILSIRTAQHWFNRFKSGNLELDDLPRPGKPLPHVAKSACEKLSKLGWITIPYPPYSPDLAPTDYHLFRSLSHHLREKNFDDENDVKMDIANFFGQKSQDFYESGILSLPERWQQVIDSSGAYISES
ncbi:unnamed protein product [Rotaria socialis]